MRNLSRLNRRQLDKLSDIFSDVALVALAVLAVPALFDRWDPLRVVLGLIATIFFWYASLILRK